MAIEQQINEEQFDFISKRNKEFIITFTHALESIGYTYGGDIGKGHCWGKYMLVFRRANVSSPKVYARIYIREDSIVLRLFLNNVTKHSAYISTATGHIKNVFIGAHGTCRHCSGDTCKFRKDYEIDGKKYEKCNGTTFEFGEPTVEKLEDYLNLFKEFYPVKSV